MNLEKLIDNGDKEEL